MLWSIFKQGRFDFVKFGSERVNVVGKFLAFNTLSGLLYVS